MKKYLSNIELSKKWTLLIIIGGLFIIFGGYEIAKIFQENRLDKEQNALIIGKRCFDANITSRNYYLDEGIFTYNINSETVERVTGINSWTQKKDDYYFVHYQNPSEIKSNLNPKGLRLDAIDGFRYNPRYEYIIRVEKTRASTYKAVDVGRYDYKLVCIAEKSKIK